MALLPTRDEQVPGRAGFAELTMADMPSMEILVIDGIASWIFSPDNPGKDYTGEHGGAVVTRVLEAVQGASKFKPELVPVLSPAITDMRERVLEGIHEISGTATALSTFVITLMPAVISELDRRTGDPASQLYWIYCYCILVLAGGRSGDLDQNLMIGIMASFDGWNDLMSGGFTLPWRAEAPSQA
ncbi:hypothetical protein ABIB25_004301 [Nakamurella sp. UYEF19]|uniref:hypothetical protein n=1 Tax=Nakamurella sp. UYEF19 TaxID=1756392 RepID=UPI00339A55B9